MSLVVVIVTACSLSAACAAHNPPSAPAIAAASPIRGNEEQADSVSDQDRRAVYRTLLRNFYRPTSGQARPRHVHVYASYKPHGGAVRPTSELRFTLVRRSDEWRIADKTSVASPEK